MIELTDNDRQRIEQEAKKNMRKYYGTDANFLLDSSDPYYELKLYKDGAKNATIYERQQQANGVCVSCDKETEVHTLCLKCAIKLGHDNPPPELEAERNELKNLLDECIKHLEWIGYGDSYERECAARLMEQVEKYQKRNKEKEYNLE